MATSAPRPLSINDLHMRFSPKKESTSRSASPSKHSTSRANSPLKHTNSHSTTPNEGSTSRSTSPKRHTRSSSTMTAPAPPLPPQGPITTIPLGFAGQLKALQDTQARLESRITHLEHEDSQLKDTTQDLEARISVLEHQNTHLASRRRETVSQFLKLQTLHQEAGNAFHLRTQDIQPDDVEGMLGVWAGSVTMVMNHHQRILGKVAAKGQLGNQMQGSGAGQYAACPPVAMWYAQYPMAYTEAGYCRAHGVPYWCRACGQ